MERAVAIVAAGTGEGKTSVGLGLAARLIADGHQVAAFKAGPDYIDAALYARVTGERARNLDLWLDGRERIVREVSTAHAGGRIVLIEGMMGLFDGDDEGETSTAHILALLGIPAIVVLDGWRMSQTAAAVVAGLANFEPRVEIAGAILNRSGGEAHTRAVRRALESAGIPLLATIPYSPVHALPERLLGIDIHARDASAGATALAEHLHGVVGYDVRPAVSRATSAARGAGPVIAFADDAAFWFTYPQTLDALADAGATLVPFSPLRDSALPPGTRGLWLGGGYPEAHAAALESNVTLRTQIRQRAADGMPIYAECGGLMYLAEYLETADGRFEMCGALHGGTSIAAPSLHMAYRSMQAAADSILDRDGDALRGYEFHYATGAVAESPAYRSGGDVGALRSNVLASFVHRRFHPGDSSVCRFVEYCRS